MACAATTLVGCSTSYSMVSAAQAGLTASTTAVSFGNVAVGTVATSPVNFTNQGEESIEISQLALTGSSFSVANQTAIPVIVPAGGTYKVTIQFDPAATGTVAGQLTLTSNSADATAMTVALNGVGQVTATAPVAPAPFPYTGSAVQNTFETANPGTPISNDFFGMTVANLAPNSLESQPGMTPFPDYSISTFRFWDVAYWAMIESYQGQQNWTKMDNSLAIAQKGGVQDFIFTFGRVPAWASTNPTDPCTGGEGLGSCAPPNMQAFDSFATQVVQRYCGKIKYFEPWNEPNSTQFWDGTNEQLLTIAQHVSQIAKDPANCGCTNGKCSPNGGANPNKVLMPPISNLTAQSMDWLESYLDTSGSSYSYADIASFHGYVYSGFPPEEIASTMQPLRQTLAAHGLGNEELWNTETSFELDSNLTQQQQVSWLMRYLMVQVALNVPRTVWYSYDNCTWGTLWSSPLCTNNQSPTGQMTSPGVAYGTMQKWLLGNTFNNCQQFNNGLWICSLTQPSGASSWVLWSSTGADITVPVPNSLGMKTYRDWQNNITSLSAQITVGQLPVFLNP